MKSWPLTEEQMLTYYTMVERANQEKEKEDIKKREQEQILQNLSEDEDVSPRLAQWVQARGYYKLYTNLNRTNDQRNH